MVADIAVIPDFPCADYWQGQYWLMKWCMHGFGLEVTIPCGHWFLLPFSFLLLWLVLSLEQLGLIFLWLLIETIHAWEGIIQGEDFYFVSYPPILDMKPDITVDFFEKGKKYMLYPFSNVLKPSDSSTQVRRKFAWLSWLILPTYPMVSKKVCYTYQYCTIPDILYRTECTILNHGELIHHLGLYWHLIYLASIP